MDWIQLAITMLPAANMNLLVWNWQIFFSVYTLINKTKYNNWLTWKKKTETYGHLKYIYGNTTTDNELLYMYNVIKS
jgi:hypothetical protein